MKKNYKKKIKLFCVFICLIAIYSIFSNFTNINMEHTLKNEKIVETHQYFSNNTNSVYLSDIDYIEGISYAGWDEIRYDQINDGSKISLKIENGSFSFEKGIWAHASSQIAYDLSKYNYKYFTAFVGLNTTSARGDGVKFEIVTSKDGENWEKKYEEVKLPQQTATFVKIDITGARFLILTADKISNNASDHAVYADAKLVNDAEESFVLKSANEYNEIIKSLYNGQFDITDELEFNLLKKELVQNVGQYTINSFYNENEDNKAVIDWLMSNKKALRYYILGGKPEGSYYNSLTELSRLYRNYKEDFMNSEVTPYGTVLGDLYTRMAISLSLTHSKVVGLWMQSGAAENKSDSVRRYAIYKYMHKNGYMKALDNLDITKWFENYTIEEMRFVMNNNIDDEEILWLNVYTQERLDTYHSAGYLTPHSYISYVYPNYGQALYYDEENKEYFNDLFSVPDKEKEGERIGLWDLSFTIPGGKDVPEYTIKVTRGTSEYKLYKVWMNMRNKFGTGAVCGGISKTGSNIRGVHGIPSAVIGQPGHAAIIYYTQDANGNGYWNLDNDVSGWAYSEKGERMLLGWGNAAYSRGYSVVYMALAQEVINDNDKFEQSEKFVYLADTYKDDLVKKEEAYRKALEIQPLNIDAWYGLINLYNESSDKTEEEYYELAEELAESLKYFPLPMTHLSNLIKPKLTSIEYSYRYTLLQTRILTEASVVPNNTADNYYVYQPSLTRLMGKFLLGNFDSTIATFSFDGEDAEKIVLASRFDGSGVRWDYSIDGKKTWKEVSFNADEPHKWQLTKEEIASITSENDLYIHIVGVNYDEENLYKIDINESTGLPTTLFASDLENKLLGAVGSMEWKYNEEDDWTFYKDEEPELTGNKTIIVRMGATGTNLKSNDSVTYTFTEDIVNNKRKYIPVSHLTLENVSTEATNQQGSATFALDANYNTRWHSAWNGSDTERYITVKLDQPYNISAVEFVPAGGGNGKIYDGTVYGSMDGENWIILSQKKGLTYTNAANDVEQAIANIKSFDVDVPQRVQYVKIVADRTNGNWFTARAFNFYEDTTIKIVANFTFDGATSGEINLIDSEYAEDWEYSLDGGNTWSTATGNKHQLTNKEINKITSENGIKIKFANDENEYSIKIKEAEELVLTPYINDLENRLIGLTDTRKLEWKYSDSEEWTSYSEEEPIVKGTRILQIRQKATGITLPSNVIEFQFTEDNQANEMKYIPVKHLSIHGYSTQSVDSKRPYYAPNVIDGNPNTEWHTDFRYSIANSEAYIAIKLDKPRYISGLDYLHMDSTKEPYGFMKNGKVYVSEDGENWKEVAEFTDVAQDSTLKHVSFNESIYGQYVKLVIESYDNVFAAASMINLYEDRSQVTPNISIKYDITNKTNQSVTAELISDKTITIMNNEGNSTYTFKENGSFTFEYEDQTGEKGTITATVDWIDKVAPTGTINYSTRDVTNENVTATLVASEEVTITNNNGSNTYIFEENGEFTFEFIDAAGNKGTATANVTWINKNAPTATIVYSTRSLTNQDVTAILVPTTDIVVLNNNGKLSYTFTKNGTFTFEFVDSIGNRGTATATVDWIDKEAPTATLEYSTTKLTNQDVIATLKDFSEEVTILNNNGHAMYTFAKNGEFEFIIQDKAGNETKIKATVNNIDKDVPVATLDYSTKELTNQNVDVTIKFDKENVKITNYENKTYTFEKNGEFTFEFIDEAGNKGTITATVDWIDKVAPSATVEYSTTKLTNKNVTVTLKEYSEEISIINNNGANTYEFTENGSFEFIIQDKAGNVSKIKAEVNNIDKIAPTASVEYSTTAPTSKNVTVTLKNYSEEITITNNEGKNTYVFTENGRFTFEFVDKAGNAGTAVAIVNNINHDLPSATLKYSSTELTNQDVVVTLAELSEGAKIVNNNGSNTYIFTENGEFEFIIQNEAGNEAKIKAVVNNIDKVAPTASIEYSTTELTNKNVTVTLKDISEQITVLNNNGELAYVFTENGVFEFEIKDQAGNVSKIKAEVNNIDKIVPTATLEYSTTELTKDKVVVTIKDFSEEVTITNNGGNNTYTFTENGTFTFEFVDKAGNIGTAKAIVTNIVKEVKPIIVEYSTTERTNKFVTVTLNTQGRQIEILNNNGSNTYTFEENGEFIFEYIDEDGNTGTVQAIVNNIDKVVPTAEVGYSTTEQTTGYVIATLKDFSEEVIVVNNNGEFTYRFTENGTFEFIVQDKAGNQNKIVATVNWISKENDNINLDSKDEPTVEKPIKPDDTSSSKPNNNSQNNNINNSNNEQSVDKKQDSNSNDNEPETNNTIQKPSNEKEKDADNEIDRDKKTVNNYVILAIILVSILLFILLKKVKKSNEE